MIKKVFKLVSDYWYMRKLFLQLPEKKSINKKIVFNTIKVDPTTFAYEVFMAAILSKEGATTYNIIDDGTFEHIDQKQVFQSDKELKNIKQNNSIKNKISFFLLVSLSKFAFGRHINFIKTSEINFKSEEDRTERKEFDLIVESSVRRFFKTPFNDRSNKTVNEYYKRCYSVCDKSQQIGMYIENVLNADKLITSHGIYSTWGPCFNYIKHNTNINIQIYGQLGHKKKEMLIADERLQILGGTMDLLRFISKKLNKKQREVILDYFDKRISLKTEDAKIYYKEVNAEVSFEPVGKVYAAFPNVISEADIAERHYMFDHIIDWLLTTINVFKENEENTLIIRCHPAEATMNSSKLSVENELYRLCPELDSIKNVVIIPSAKKINTYEMIKEKIDVGMIYEGVLGLELAMLEKPVILCGKGRLSGNGFGIEPLNIENYKTLLQSPTGIIANWEKEKMKELAMSIGYWNFYESAYYIPTIADHYEPGFQFYKNRVYKEISIDEINPEINPDFSKTVNKLLN